MKKNDVDKYNSELDEDISKIDYSLLEKYAENKGGLLPDFWFEYPQFEDQGPILMKGYKTLNSFRDLPNVYFGILNNSNLNASAVKTKVNETFLVYINSGLLNEICLFINEFNEWNKDQFYKQNSNWLFTLFMNIVMEHELSHIFYGHLNYIEAEFGKHEFTKTHSDKSINFIVQTLEMNADCFGLSRIYGWLVNISEMKDIPKVKGYRYEIIEGFSDVIMAFYCLNKFYFDLNTLTIQPGKTKHLTPRERIIIAFGNLYAAVEGLRPEINIDDVIKKSISKLEWVDIVFNEAYGTPKNEEFWKDKSSYLNQTDFITSLLENWENINKDLKKHTYSKLKK